jgi:UTP--glucose-1-phosphate uridylyltransferase
MAVKRAVIPVAGLGTRFLPATKAIPKEMLPILDTPAIQIILEEAAAAGIETTVFITARGKGAIEDHFDRYMKLEHLLEEREKKEELAAVRHATELMKIAYVRQPEALGVGHAILQAKNIIGNEPFAVFFGDDLVRSSIPCIRQLIDVYNETKSSVVALEPVPLEEIHKYGIIRGKRVGERLFKLEEMIEKPNREDAPSNLAIIGRYVLTPEIFEEIENTKPGIGGEIQLTDAMRGLLRRQEIYGLVFEGKRFDTGNRLGFLKATVEYSLERDDVGAAFRRYLKDLICREKKQ